MSETSWKFLSGHHARQTWRTELEGTPTENYQQYALFDVTRVEDLMMTVYQNADLPDYEYLYSQTASKHLLAVSPVLLRLDSGDYHSLLNEAHEERAVILLTSGLSLADLAQHLRKFLLIHDGAGDSFLRFYDPACWLAQEALAQTRLIAGNMIAEVILPFWLGTDTPEWVSFTYESAPPELAIAHTGYDLNAGSEFDALCLQSRLLYWVGRHEALKGQDWLVEELLELFALVKILVQRGVTQLWQLDPILEVLVKYVDFLREKWLSEYLYTCDAKDYEASDNLQIMIDDKIKENDVNY